jgi:hypothetical protein
VLVSRLVAGRLDADGDLLDRLYVDDRTVVVKLPGGHRKTVGSMNGADGSGEVESLPPTWSPDGRQVAWTSVDGTTDDDEVREAIDIVDRDGRHPRRIWLDDLEGVYSPPAWQPG